jgi:hypothetical protein
MGKRLDIKPGDSFSRLTIIKEVEGKYWGKYKHRQFLCKCECGNERIVRLEYLRSGHTTSCGCLREVELIKINATHRQSGTRLHRIWASMLGRCRNKSHTSYKDYGAKGVKVCVEWYKFEKFRDWALENGYREDLTIDRINPFGNYETSNCRWATMLEQRHNRRSDYPGGKYDQSKNIG